MSTKEITGTSLLRSALRARNAKVNLSLLARDVSLNGDAVHNFIHGGDLPSEQKVAIADYLFAGHTVFVPELDLLQPAKSDPATPMGILPTLDPKLLRTYRPGACQTSAQPAKDSVPVKPRQRPGWVGGLW
jgi:hypothetical protein